MMIEPLQKESKYPNLVEFLQSGGKLEIGKNSNLKSFALIQMNRVTRTVETMNYDDFDGILKAMDHQAKCYIEDNW